MNIGAGYDKTLSEVRKEHPDLKGRMFVQNLPAVMQKHKRANEVEAMPFGFLDPRLIKGKDTRIQSQLRCFKPYSGILNNY